MGSKVHISFDSLEESENRRIKPREDLRLMESRKLRVSFIKILWKHGSI